MSSLKAMAGSVFNWSALRTILEHSPLHVILYGPPGTGKTSAATTPDCYQVTMTPETPAAELRGHFVPRGSEFVWHHGPAMRAWLEGKRLVINEINLASGDALTFLLAVMDDPEVARLTLPNGETVRPIAGFGVVATTNCENLEAELPAALLDRMPVRIRVSEPSPEAYTALPSDLQKIAANSYANPGPDMISYRMWRAYGIMRKTYGEETALTACFGPKGKDIKNTIALAAKATEAK